MTQDKPTIEDVIDKYPQFSRRDFGLSGNDEPDYISIDSAKAAMTEYASLKNKKANEFICDIAKLLGEDNLGLDDCQWSIDDFKEAIASLNRQGWTRVEDGKPEIGDSVLVFPHYRVFPFGRKEELRDDASDFTFWRWNEYWDDVEIVKDVTHWMPLPNKPSI